MASFEPQADLVNTWGPEYVAQPVSPSVTREPFDVVLQIRRLPITALPGYLPLPLSAQTRSWATALACLPLHLLTSRCDHSFSTQSVSLLRILGYPSPSLAILSLAFSVPLWGFHSYISR